MDRVIVQILTDGSLSDLSVRIVCGAKVLLRFTPPMARGLYKAPLVLVNGQRDNPWVYGVSWLPAGGN